MSCPLAGLLHVQHIATMFADDAYREQVRLFWFNIQLKFGNVSLIE